jgi:hypothetical protein
MKKLFNLIAVVAVLVCCAIGWRRVERQKGDTIPAGWRGRVQMTAPTYIRIVDDDEDYDNVAFYDNGDHWLVVFRDGGDQIFKLRVNPADNHIVTDILNRYPRCANEHCLPY